MTSSWFHFKAFAHTMIIFIEMLFFRPNFKRKKKHSKITFYFSRNKFQLKISIKTKTKKSILSAVSKNRKRVKKSQVFPMNLMNTRRESKSFSMIFICFLRPSGYQTLPCFVCVIIISSLDQTGDKILWWPYTRLPFVRSGVCV